MKIKKKHYMRQWLCLPYSVNIAHFWACRSLFSSASLASCSVRPDLVRTCDQSTYHLWAVATPWPSALFTAEGIRFGRVYLASALFLNFAYRHHIFSGTIHNCACYVFVSLQFLLVWGNGWKSIVGCQKWSLTSRSSGAGLLVNYR